MIKNKIVDYFFMIANALFMLGIVITSILVINDINQNYLESRGFDRVKLAHLSAFIVCTIISFTFIMVFLWSKYNYFKLIKMHITTKYIWMHYFASSILLSLYVLATLFFILCPLVDIKTLTSFYFYVGIAIFGILGLFAIGLNSYSNIKIKIELAIRRTKGKDDDKEGNK